MLRIELFLVLTSILVLAGSIVVFLSYLFLLPVSLSLSYQFPVLGLTKSSNGQLMLVYLATYVYPATHYNKASSALDQSPTYSTEYIHFKLIPLYIM